jgi:hypothetical protein
LCRSVRILQMGSASTSPRARQPSSPASPPLAGHVTRRACPMPCRQICSRLVLELEQVDGSAARALREGRFLYRGFACDPSGGEGYRAAPFLLCREGRRAPAKWKGSWDIRGVRFGTSCIVSHILDPSGGEGFRAAPFLLCRKGRRALEIVTRRSRESLHPPPKDLATRTHLAPAKWKRVRGRPWSTVRDPVHRLTHPRSLCGRGIPCRSFPPLPRGSQSS